VARIVFTSAGFWGDVTPYVPIANALVERGHDVVYAVPPDFDALLAGERFRLADSGSTFSPQDVLRDDEQLHLLEHRAMAMSGAVLARYWAKRYVVDELDQIVTALTRVLDGADLMVTHPTMGTVSSIAADVAGVPWVTGHLFPMMVPTRERPPGAMRMPRALNRALWAGTTMATSLMMGDRDINRFRTERGLPRIRANMLLAGMSTRCTMVLTSPLYFPPPADWPSHIEVTGFTVWPGPAGQPVAPEVEAFLDAGDAPVLVTLGTSAASVARKTFETVAVRLDDMGLRGLFLVGDIGDIPRSLEGRPGVFRFAPLHAVLPRCRAIVQSGSHGTNAAALHAGVPSVTIPLIFDQVWHGQRLEELGLGVMVKGRSRKAERVWDALRAVTEDERYTERARAFAARLAEEDGVAAACDAIERALAPPLPPRGPTGL
jgi:rhamnosyltransferase subunit B